MRGLPSGEDVIEREALESVRKTKLFDYFFSN